MSILLASLLLVFTALCGGDNTILPQTVEIDLVFPRNNTSYMPTNYFPIVFAVQKASIAWPLGLQVSGEVRSKLDPNDFDHWDGFNLGGEFTEPGPTSGNATADPSLLIRATSAITNTTELQFTVLWSSHIINTCEEDGEDYATDIKHIIFNTSLNGIAPDIAAAVNSCSTQFSLIELDRNTNHSIVGQSGKICTFDVFARNGTGKGNPCALKPLAQTIAANVSKAMCVAENGTIHCNAGQRSMYSVLGISSLMVLVATISAICYSL